MSVDKNSIFDYLYPTYKITKPIRLIELFAGYGSQALALKYLGSQFEHWKICEWAVKSIQAYKDIHFPNTRYVVNLNKDELIEKLYKKGISQDYNVPMTKEQIARLGEEKLKEIYGNIKITHNLVNIQNTSADDLEIIDKDKYTYLLTYSFPCQDLSLAGKREGMKDTTTRSGMLWEVERILCECKLKHCLPDLLLMENVPQVHCKKTMSDFVRWQLKLETLGYTNYWKDLNAKDFGVPQNRERCFMVSILGEYNYTFPKTMPLRKRLKDLLETNVDEKYYLSEKMVNYIKADNEKWTGNNNQSVINKSIASTLNTKEGGRRCDASNYIVPSEEKEDVDIKKYNFEKNIKIKTANSNGICKTEYIKQMYHWQ